jgi:phosphoesterase RecJ-like protein
MFGNIYLVASEAVAASEIVYDWLLAFGHPISQLVATALLTGMVTDTMGFRTNHVVPRTLEVTHQLMLAGGPLVDIINRTMVSKPINHIMLWKHVFPSVEYKDGIASAVVTSEDLKAAYLSEMTDAGLVSTLVAADEVLIAVVFKVEPNNKVELSFRSKAGYDVAAVAFALGGGGHKPAAGATVVGTLDEVKAQVMPMLQAVIQQGKQASV